MAGSEIRIGVIGVGAIGPSHIYAINQVDGARLAAVCDIREEAASAEAEKNGVPYFTSVEEMVRSGEVDAVTVSTPSGYHLEATLTAIENDTHVLVEKPLEITTERIDQIIEAEKKSKAIVAGVYQSRFKPIVSKMKSLIDNGLIGEIYSGSVYIKRYRTQDYYDSGGWRGTWKVDGGGCLMNQGIHFIDLFIWFLGDVESAIGVAETKGRNVEVETIAQALVGFRGGVRGVVEATTLAYPEWSPYIEIYGSRGTVAFEGTRLRSMELIDPTQQEEDAKKELEEISKVTAEAEAKRKAKAAAGTAVPNVDMGHAPVIEDFVSAIQDGRAPLINSTEARKAVALIRAIYESGQNGNKPVYP